MTPPPINIDGTDITGATIDGQDVEQITIDGQDVLSAIPDKGDLHARYDATELSLSDGDSVSTWADETGNGFDLAAGTAPTYKTGVINNNPVVRFDGSDDFLDVAFSALSQPNHIFAVLRFPDASGRHYVFDTDSGGQHALLLESGSWRLFAGSSLNGSAAGSGTNYITASLFNGSSSEHRVNGSTDVSGDAGSNSLDGLSMGIGNNVEGRVDVGEFLIYPQDKSGITTDVEAYLSTRWDISV